MTINATAGSTGSDYTTILSILGDADTDRISITATKVVLRSPDFGVDIVFTGTGFDGSSGPFMGAGTVTGMQIRNTSNNALLLNFTGMNFSGDAFDQAIFDAQNGNSIPLTQLLFQTDSYKLTGGNGADEFLGSTLDDVLNGGG